MTAVGLMGGSFDPIHNGHLWIAHHAFTTAHLDHVLFLPSGRPPHKTALGATAQKRLEMTELALDGCDWGTVSDLEIRRTGTIYTVDTLCQLRALHPTWSLQYIIGADTLMDLASWRCFSQVTAMCRFLCVMRPGVHEDALTSFSSHLLQTYGADVVLLPYVGPDISSTAVRNAVAADAPLDNLIPPQVQRYIKENHLYLPAERINENG